jgi:hypothetical protein
MGCLIMNDKHKFILPGILAIVKVFGKNAMKFKKNLNLFMYEK